MSPWIRLQRDRLALVCMGFLGGVLVLGLLAPILPLSDPTLIDVGDKFAPWSWHHPFGTDQLGRDVLSRLVYGIRATVFLSLLTMAITSALGACVGLVSGFFRNRIDDVLMRICDVMMSFPSEVMILAIVGMTGRAWKTWSSPTWWPSGRGMRVWSVPSSGSIRTRTISGLPRSPADHPSGS